MMAAGQRTFTGEHLTLVRHGAAQRRFDHEAEFASRRLFSANDIVCCTAAESNLRRAINKLARIARGIVMHTIADATEFTQAVRCAV